MSSEEISKLTIPELLELIRNITLELEIRAMQEIN